MISKVLNWKYPNLPAFGGQCSVLMPSGGSGVNQVFWYRMNSLTYYHWNRENWEFVKKDHI